MRNLYKQYGRVTLAGTDSVGNFKQRDAIAARWTTSTSPRSEIDAQALRVFAASGFGDATIGGEPHRVLDSVDHYHRARAHRSYMLAEIVKTMLQAVGDVVRRMVVRIEAAATRLRHLPRAECTRYTHVARSRIPSQRTDVSCRRVVRRSRDYPRPLYRALLTRTSSTPLTGDHTMHQAVQNPRVRQLRRRSATRNASRYRSAFAGISTAT